MTKEKTKGNQITEGIIWQQLLFFFFPILFGTFFQQLYNAADTMIEAIFWVMNRWQQSVHVQRFMNCW